MQAHPRDHQPGEAVMLQGETVKPCSHQHQDHHKTGKDRTAVSLVHPKEAMITCGRRGVGWEGKDAGAGGSDTPVWPPGSNRPGWVSVHMRRGRPSWPVTRHPGLASPCSDRLWASAKCETKNCGCRKSRFLSGRMFAPA